MIFSTPQAQPFSGKNLGKNENVMLIAYENLVQNPQQQFKTIFKFPSLKYTPRISKHVHSRLIRLREPKQIDPKVRELCEQLHQKLMQLTLK